MTRKHTFHNSAVTAGIISVIATCFFIPLSTSLMGICSALVFFFWIVSGKVCTLPRQFFSQPIVFWAMVLSLLFVIGLAYSPIPVGEAAKTLAKYRELLFIPAVISLLLGNENAARHAENSFVTGCILLLISSYCIYFSILPPMKYGNSVLFHITHSFFMALLAFWSIQRSLDSKQYRYFWLLLFIGATINIVYINPGRTGMLVFIMLMLLTLVQRLSIRKMLTGVLIFTSLLAVAYYSSDNLSTRTQQALTEIQDYQQGVSRTSLGQRFDWWHNSVDLIHQAPFFGHGTGSFAVLQQELIKGKKTMPTDNPHNEYLFIAVQLGGLGILSFLLLLATQFVGSLRMARQPKYLVQGIIVAMATGCVMNSFLFDSHQGHFYAFLSAIYFTSSQRNKKLKL